MDEELAMKKMGILNAFVAAVLAASPVFALADTIPR
jgi:hypothetical protein